MTVILTVPASRTGGSDPRRQIRPVAVESGQPMLRGVLFQGGYSTLVRV
jgi:hypothetical protein